MICDYSAFLSGRPDLHANRMWVRRDNGHSDMLLPPDFVGAGNWYKEGYEHLYFKLRRKGEVDAAQLRHAQDTVGRDLLEAYRRQQPWSTANVNFLLRQDAYCRQLARQEGEFVS